MCIDGFIVHICTAYVRVYLSHLIIVSFHLRLFYFMSIFFFHFGSIPISFFIHIVYKYICSQVWRLFPYYTVSASFNSVQSTSIPVALALSIAFANSSLHRTRLPSFAHSKNAPLSFRCRLYVSSGGGVSRSRSMSGISARTRSVMVWLLKS